MSDCCPPPVSDAVAPILEARGVEVRAGGRPLIRNVSFAVRPGQVFGLIGPSGAGKSTLLRALNRLTDLIPGLRVSGEVLLHGASIFAPGVDVDALRAKVGMLFQQPVIFPASIADNVLFGAGRLRKLSRSERAHVIESALHEAALWDEVKDRLRTSANSLSVGQQQRLCLARALAVQPEIILMDEPTSALDPKSTQAIEELIVRLKVRHTIVIVTHNVAQARRVTDWIACICVRDGSGEIVESACCDAVLDNPQCREVIEYLRAFTMNSAPHFLSPTNVRDRKFAVALLMSATSFYKRSNFVTHLPVGCLYSPSHFWLARIEGERWRVGFTKFATRMLGEIVEVQWEKTEGDAVASGAIIGSIEGFKAISDIYCVADGTFAGGNPALRENIEKVGADPYGQGWLYEIQGDPDAKCVDLQTYRSLLDSTIDRILEKQSTEGAE